MGDRVIFQVVRGYDRETKTALEFGPAIYGHWSGHEWREHAAAVKKHMAGCNDDVAYSSARLLQNMIVTPFQKNDNCGFGIWNTTKVLTVDDNPGDAGIILIDCGDDHAVIPICGYSYRQQHEVDEDE